MVTTPATVSTNMVTTPATVSTNMVTTPASVSTNMVTTPATVSTNMVTTPATLNCGLFIFSDVDTESGLIPGNSGSSSSSSLSHGLDSPSTSFEHVVSRTDAPLPAPVLENDSDIEAEVDLPNWQKLVSDEEIKKLKPKERKRQDTINELFHTERTHVRVLKVLKHLFQVPMTEAELLPKDQLDILFPNMDQMLEIHIVFNQAMKKRREEEPLVFRVGDLLIDMASILFLY
nr:rho guanine nucleotide exchange factor 11-like [Cherax quadricarinatus]